MCKRPIILVVVSSQGNHDNRYKSLYGSAADFTLIPVKLRGITLLNFASSKQRWTRVLIAMSKSIKKDGMEFLFYASGDGWDYLSSERVVEMININHVPPSIERLWSGLMHSSRMRTDWMDWEKIHEPQIPWNLSYVRLWKEWRSRYRNHIVKHWQPWTQSNHSSCIRQQISLVAFNGFDGIQEY